MVSGGGGGNYYEDTFLYLLNSLIVCMHWPDTCILPQNGWKYDTNCCFRSEMKANAKTRVRNMVRIVIVENRSHSLAHFYMFNLNLECIGINNRTMQKHTYRTQRKMYSLFRIILIIISLAYYLRHFFAYFCENKRNSLNAKINPS